MAGLVGAVQSVYSDDEISVRVEPASMTPVTAEVHREATMRMRNRFQSETSEEQKKSLTKEEMEFDANYVVIVQASDLEAA